MNEKITFISQFFIVVRRSNYGKSTITPKCYCNNTLKYSQNLTTLVKMVGSKELYSMVNYK